MSDTAEPITNGEVTEGQNEMQEEPPLVNGETNENNNASPEPTKNGKKNSQSLVNFLLCVLCSTQINLTQGNPSDKSLPSSPEFGYYSIKLT